MNWNDLFILILMEFHTISIEDEGLRRILIGDLSKVSVTQETALGHRYIDEDEESILGGECTSQEGSYQLDIASPLHFDIAKP